jgi:hypothetical protein
VIACAISGLNRRNAVSPFGRPVQHLSPITSYARFEGVLAHLENSKWHCEALGFTRIEDVLRTLKMASGYASAASRNLIFDN